MLLWQEVRLVSQENFSAMHVSLAVVSSHGLCRKEMDPGIGSFCLEIQNSMKKAS